MSKPWIPFYVSDYLRNTAPLSARECGARMAQASA